MMIKCPCLLDSDQLSPLEDSKSPHIAHIRGLLVKLHSQLLVGFKIKVRGTGIK